MGPYVWPHVSRSTSGCPRASTYNSFARRRIVRGSTAGASEGCAIQGTFPSAERIRVRWVDADGRRRVGVEEVKGEMNCTICGKGIKGSMPEVEGVIMSVEYKGQCRGVWFPGVASLLGLDVSLEAKGSDISWAQGYSNQWEILNLEFDTLIGILCIRQPPRDELYSSIFILLILWAPSGWVILQDVYCIDIVSTTIGFYLFDNLVILHHIYCIDIVSNTSQFYPFDNPLMMSYIPVYLFYCYCEPHRDELYCRTFIVLILWALQQGFIYLTPWL